MWQGESIRLLSLFFKLPHTWPIGDRGGKLGLPQLFKYITKHTCILSLFLSLFFQLHSNSSQIPPSSPSGTIQARVYYTKYDLSYYHRINMMGDTFILWEMEKYFWILSTWGHTIWFSETCVCLVWRMA